MYGIDHLIALLIQSGIDARLAGRSAAYHAEFNGSFISMRLPKFLATLGWCYVVLGLFFATKAQLSYPERFSVLFGIMGMLMLLVGMMLIRYWRRHSVLFNEEEAWVKGLFGGHRHFKWSDIRSGRLHAGQRQLKLRLQDGRKVTMCYQLIGFRAFLGQLQQRTPVPVATWTLPSGL